MSKPESTSTIQTAQLSAHSKDARKIDRTNAEIVQNALLIWLDSNIDENNNDYRNNMSHLRNVINVVNTFTDSEECIHFLGDMADEKAGIIISNSLVNRLHLFSTICLRWTLSLSSVMTSKHVMKNGSRISRRSKVSSPRLDSYVKFSSKLFDSVNKMRSPPAQ